MINAMAYVHKVAYEALESEHCYPVVQKILEFPSVVYYGVGQQHLTTLDHGAQQTATAVRVEARARPPRPFIPPPHTSGTAARAPTSVSAVSGLSVLCGFSCFSSLLLYKWQLSSRLTGNEESNPSPPLTRIGSPACPQRRMARRGPATRPVSDWLSVIALYQPSEA